MLRTRAQPASVPDSEEQHPRLDGREFRNNPPSLDARRKMMDDDLQAAALRTDMSLFAENEWIVGKREYSPEELSAIGGD